MELKQRKKINNIPKFNGGIDSKVGFGQQYQANDLTSMIGGNTPTGSAIAGAGSSSASLILVKNRLQVGIQKAEFRQPEEAE